VVVWRQNIASCDFCLAGLRPEVPTRPSRPGAHTKSPRRKPGDSGWHAFPGAMRYETEPGNGMPSSGMDGELVFVPGVPGLPPGASRTTRAIDTQKAPGGSRGTPGGMPSQVPCDMSLNREMACRHPAWMASWFSCPVSPGCHPGLLGSERCVTGQADHANHRWPRSQASRPFCTCIRLAASSTTTLCGPSITSSVTSSPRRAGRQCMNRASGQCRISAAFT